MILKGYNSSAIIRDFQTQLLKLKLGQYQYNQVFGTKGHVILTSLDKKKPRFYCIYKRDFYKTFEKHFFEFCLKNPQMKGEGESINIKALKNSINYNIDYIVFIHPEEVYVAYPMQIKRFCEKFELTKIQKRKNINNSKLGAKITQEITYSFPKKLLKKFEEIKII